MDTRLMPHVLHLTPLESAFLSTLDLLQEVGIGMKGSIRT